MLNKDVSLRALDKLRSGVLRSERTDIDSVQKRYLDSMSPSMSAVTFDVKHRPASTNGSRHLALQHVVGAEMNVTHQAFLPLKRKQAPNTNEQSPAALLVLISGNGTASILTLEGDVLVQHFDLGHNDSEITQLSMSPSQDAHFIITGDVDGMVRVHNIKVIAKREVLREGEEPSPPPVTPNVSEGKATKDDGSDDTFDEDAEPPFQSLLGKAGAALADMEANANRSRNGTNKTQARIASLYDQPVRIRKQLLATLVFSCEFGPALMKGGEGRDLRSVLAVERGSQTYFVTGDALGGIGVFHRNGTLKGRTIVTDDPGGVLGLLRAQGQSLLFWSSHSFGSFSISQMDVQSPPCSGWDSPVYDMVLDPHYASSRVMLALSDGDVLIFATTRGKSKACDLSLKFPRVSDMPFQLLAYKGHVMALPNAIEAKQNDALRELVFFDPGTMEIGYGSAASRSVVLQVSFEPLLPRAMMLLPVAGSGNEKAKAILAMRLEPHQGVALFDLYLKQPPPPKSAEDDSSWLDWFPKVGVFGVVLVGVVIWNVRKETSGMEGFGGGGGMDEKEMEQLVANAMKGAGGGE